MTTTNMECKKHTHVFVLITEFFRICPSVTGATLFLSSSFGENFGQRVGKKSFQTHFILLKYKLVLNLDNTQNELSNFLINWNIKIFLEYLILWYLRKKTATYVENTVFRYKSHEFYTLYTIFIIIKIFLLVELWSLSKTLFTNFINFILRYLVFKSKYVLPCQISIKLYFKQ